MHAAKKSPASPEATCLSAGDLSRARPVLARWLAVPVDPVLVQEIEEYLTEAASPQTWQEFLTQAAWGFLRRQQGT